MKQGSLEKTVKCDEWKLWLSKSCHCRATRSVGVIKGWFRVWDELMFLEIFGNFLGIFQQSQEFHCDCTAVCLNDESSFFFLSWLQHINTQLQQLGRPLPYTGCRTVAALLLSLSGRVKNSTRNSIRGGNNTQCSSITFPVVGVWGKGIPYPNHLFRTLPKAFMLPSDRIAELCIAIWHAKNPSPEIGSHVRCLPTPNDDRTWQEVDPW